VTTPADQLAVFQESLDAGHRIAVVVRCGANKGRCGGLLGAVTVPRLTTCGGQRFILLLPNRPRRQTAIPMDFSGGVDFMACPNSEGRLKYRKDDTGRVKWSGIDHWSRRTADGWVDGDGAGPWPWPAGLREAVDKFRHTGRTQEFHWNPWPTTML